MGASILIAELPPVSRLALAYAPRSHRSAWLAVLSLDNRLCGIVRQAREPLLAQIRLSWWRERLAEDPARWPQGEPLLQLIGGAIPQPERLAAMVDGWEALLGDAPLAAETLAMAAAGRARGLSWLSADGFAAAQGWVLFDMAGRLSHPDEREAVLALMRAADWQVPRLPRLMRPLVVLLALARRQAAGKTPGGAAALFTALRAGLLGR